MKIEISIDIEQQKGETPGELERRSEKYDEIFRALISCGALDGVKGGSAELHFDQQAVFQGVQLHYFPWRKRGI